MSTPKYSTEPREPESTRSDMSLSSFTLSAEIEHYLQWRHLLERRLKQGVSLGLDRALRDYVNVELTRMDTELTRRDCVAVGGVS